MCMSFWAADSCASEKLFYIQYLWSIIYLLNIFHGKNLQVTINRLKGQ